jgi:hypothetical protein
MEGDEDVAAVLVGERAEDGLDGVELTKAPGSGRQSVSFAPK